MPFEAVLGTRTHHLLQHPTAVFRSSVCLNSSAFVLVALAKELQSEGFLGPEKLRHSLQIEGGLPFARSGKCLQEHLPVPEVAPDMAALTYLAWLPCTDSVMLPRTRLSSVPRLLYAQPSLNQPPEPGRVTQEPQHELQQILQLFQCDDSGDASKWFAA